MIYGLNFNGTIIPDGVRKKFKQRLKAPDGRRADLAGVGQSPDERDAMIAAASRPGRDLHVVSKQTAAGTWYGIYVKAG